MPAPASGANNRNPSRAVCSTPLASASSSSGSIVASNPERPAPSTVKENPYASVTA